MCVKSLNAGMHANLRRSATAGEASSMQQHHRPLVKEGNAAQHCRHCSHATLHRCVGHSCRSALPPAHLTHGHLADVRHCSGMSFCASDHRCTQISRQHINVRVSQQWVCCFAAAGDRAAQADIVYEAVRSSARPETDSRTAVVNLLDAKGTLLELKVQSVHCHVHPSCSRNFDMHGSPHGRW